MKSTRPARTYDMATRAEAAAATERAILDAAVRHFSDGYFDDVSLDAIAADAGVTVQTVLRKFGSKDGLAAAAAERGSAEVRAQRWEAEPGDVRAAVRGLVAHYEAWGPRSLRFLAQEERVPAVRRVTEAGRALHHDWVDHAFAPWLSQARGPARERLRARLVAATDVYAWKVIRLDLGLDARDTERTLREFVDAVLAPKS